MHSLCDQEIFRKDSNMGRSFRSRVENFGKKIPANVTAVVGNLIQPSVPPCGNGTAPSASPVDSVRDGNEAGNHKKEAALRQPVYGDVSVCAALRIRRRVIAEARTKESRGRDWDCVGMHAGMTKDWIYRKALELHIVPDFSKMQPIAADDHVVSCTLACVVPDNRKVVAEFVATGERRTAWVADSSMMRLREIFDCYDDHGTLSANRDLNGIAY